MKYFPIFWKRKKIAYNLSEKKDWLQFFKKKF